MKKVHVTEKFMTDVQELLTAIYEDDRVAIANRANDVQGFLNEKDEAKAYRDWYQQNRGADKNCDSCGKRITSGTDSQTVDGRLLCACCVFDTLTA